MAKKTITREVVICDFSHKEEVLSSGVVYPSKLDACKQHMDEFKQEVRLPKELGGGMSGFYVSVDEGYYPQMDIKYKKNKKK